MNYCRKCQSDYSQPGTCNCFAPIHVGPLRVLPPITVQPLPYIGDPMPGTTFVPLTGPTIPNAPLVTWGNPHVTCDSTHIANMRGVQFTYTSAKC